MAKLLLVMGVLLAMTVGRSGGTVNLPTSERTASQERSATFACEVTGESFEAWITPSGQRITESTTGRIEVSKSGTTYTLEITTVTVEDGGSYQCQGSINFRIFVLNVNYVVQNVQSYKQTLRLGEKDDLELGVSGYPDLSYTWTKDEQAVQFGGRITLNGKTGSITFNPVQLSDEGNYTCAITSVKLGDHTFKPISAIVIEKPEIRKYQGNPVRRRLSTGYNYTFHCDVVKGSPRPEVTWYYGWTSLDKKVDSQYDSRFSHPTDEEWTITNIAVNDKDKYRCIAKNMAGEDELRFEITAVDVPPLIDPPLTDITVNEGDTRALVCKVSGTPTPTVEWLQNGFLYRDQKRSVEGNKVVKTISFTNIQWDKGGKYTCEARNGALDSKGQEIKEQQTINLNVNSPPRIIEQSSPTPVFSFVGYNKEVTVACMFSGYPEPLVKMVNTSSGQEVAQGNGSASFKIRTDSVSDFGTFNCTAENSFQSTNFLVELKTAVPPGPPRNLNPVNVTCKEVTLGWERPADNGGLKILKYTVRLVKDNNDLFRQNVGTSQLKVTIGYRQFKPETTYKVYLAAQSEAGNGNEEMLSVTTRKYCLPGRPVITNTESEVGTTFTLTWTRPPYDGGDANIKYKVEWRKKPLTSETLVFKEENIGETSLKVTNLEGGAEYEFKVSAENSEGYGEPATRSFKVKPDEVVDPEATSQGLSSGAIAGIVIAVILIVLVAIDLFCCFFNSCGLFFCCSQALCGGSGAKEKDYADGKATEMEKKKLAKENENANV